MKRNVLISFLVFIWCQVYGQHRWTLEQCMDYAVEHNHDVRSSALALDDYKADRMGAIGSFLPSVNAGVGTRFNYGRSTDPETNITTDINTFNNNYELAASIPVFDGLQRYNELRAAKASVLMGKHGLQAQQDAVKQSVLRAYIDVLYYRGTLALATMKSDESQQLLHRTKVMEELGTKGAADVAQMEATVASDDYEVSRQQGFLTTALHNLKQLMNFPLGETLDIDTLIVEENIPILETTDDVYKTAKEINPMIKYAEYSLKAARFQYRSSVGALVPSISIGAGMFTNYSSQLGKQAQPFETQFRNHIGKYVYASLYIPIFDGLGSVTRIRKSRNNLRRAQENLEYQNTELYRLIEETIIDCNNSCLEVEKMERRVSADSLATHLTVRKYEEGLASSIDMQSARITLLQSRALLLQCRLNYYFKKTILNYYNGGEFRD